VPKVFGIGVSRTGTSSLKHGLELLTFAPCYHVAEALRWPHLALLWNEYLHTGYPDPSRILANYSAACDVPIFLIWRHLLQSWPNAKFILTFRDPDSWYDSVVASILPILTGTTGPVKPGIELAHRMCREAMMTRFIGSTGFDRKLAIKQFIAHNMSVIETVPQSQLLVMHISEGWAPLCDFLEVDRPTVGFPHLNSRCVRPGTDDRSNTVPVQEVSALLQEHS
jgi:hypothetical protein